MPRGMPADLDAGVAQAFRLFRSDLGRYEADVLRAVPVPLEPHEFDALVSFHYNTGAIARAALTRALNAGDRAAAGAAFMNWLRPASLRSRREAERDLFLHGRYPEGPIPVWAADAEGRVDFRQPVRRLSAAEALALLRPPPAAAPTPVRASARGCQRPPQLARRDPCLPHRHLQPELIHALRSALVPDLVGGPRRNPHRPRRSAPARARAACRARGRRRRADRREGCRAGDADHARLRADRPARPAGARLPRRRRQADEVAAGRACRRISTAARQRSPGAGASHVATGSCSASPTTIGR